MSGPAKNLPADERRNVTIEAVVELAGTQNPAEITTQAIATHMNLTQGAIFRHFPSKEAIWQGVIGWVADKLLSRIDEAAQGEASALASIEAMFLANIDFVSAHPGAPRLMFGELQRAGETIPKRMVRTILGSYAERLVALLERGKRAGEVDSAIDCAAAASLYFGAVQGLVVRSLISGELAGMKEEAKRVFAIYRRGIAARA